MMNFFFIFILFAALMSRQFVEMTRIRIEGLLAAFPKLMGSENKQHTFIETESVRYVYQPLDGLYLLIVTNRASNIVEDLDTLRLLSKVVPNVTGTAGNLTEDKVIDKAFDLIFAFDEVITTGGHRENVTLQQIRTNMEMESHEEKLHNMIKMSKMESARDQAAAAAKSIKEKQKMVGLSSTDAALMHSHNSYSSNLGNNNLSSSSPVMPSSSSVFSAPASRGVKGMSLGGTKSKTFEDALIKEDKLAPIAVGANAVKSSSSTSAEAAVASAVVQKPLMLTAAEKVSAKITKDGNVESCEVRGSLTLTAQSEEISNCIIKLRPLPVAVTQAFSFNTHPKINKASYEKQNLLQLKDGGAGKGFPSGRPAGILKWTSTGRSEDIAPIKINCWPEEEGRGQMSVSIDFSADLKYVKSLHNVQIRIPLGTSANPTIVRIDGQSKHLTSTGELLWTLDLVDSSSFASAALEFLIAQRDENAFFPIAVAFSSEQLFCPIDVVDVTSIESNEPVDYGISSQLSGEDYVIG
jgi:hypothetical protein